MLFRSKRLIAPLAILTATVAPWLLFTLFKSGGLFTGMHYNSVMLRDNARSFFYEGFTHRATIMALFATYWNGIGALGWLWAVPAAIRRGFLADRRRHLLFLAIWFLPPYLLSAAIQVTDPDQTLASMAATCLVGAWALNAVGNRGTLLACAVNIEIGRAHV